MLSRLFVLTFLLLSGLYAGEPAAPAAGLPPGLVAPETRLEEPRSDPAWSALFERLSTQKTRYSRFEERRFFPFRREPTVLQGEIRMAPDLGLSLRYLQPEERVIVVDDKGVLMRDGEGRERAAPDDSRARIATSAMVHVLRFDLPALQKDFTLHGRRDGEAWSLAFVPRDATFANLLGVLVVSGEKLELRKIEMIKAANQRIEIAIKETSEGVLFTGDTLRRFFRSRGSD